MTDVVRLEQLTKSYGRERGIVELDLSVRPGEVFGFLGPNGAGKTTTIRTMLDLIRPTSGRVTIFGLDAQRDGVAVRRRLGYVPGDLRLYGRLTPRELFRYFGGLRGLRSLAGAERLAERFELPVDRPIAALSRGTRQKVGLVQAFMHEPDLLVLDEPTSGLDPLVQQTFNDLARETAASGRTVFLSSHVLSEVQHVADRVALVRDGRLALVDDVDSLRARALSRIEVTFGAPPPLQAFDGIEHVGEIERRGAVVVFHVRGEIDAFVKTLAQHRVVALNSHEADLEDVFLSLYRGDERRAA
ncbi:MAG TPA: ABC transporter ATP-binding protein [Gaiellaceae bacterium]|nr:ABC transporter ATP-binding protein [Gaiellaceae bacterium]